LPFRPAFSVFRSSIDIRFQGGNIMKKSIVLACLLLAAPPLLALDAYPMTSIAEVGSSVG
jgi:hypothetical protein